MMMMIYWHSDHYICNAAAGVYRVDTHGVVGGDGAVLLLRARASPGAGAATTATARGAPGACTYNEGLLGLSYHVVLGEVSFALSFYDI